MNYILSELGCPTHKPRSLLLKPAKKFLISIINQIIAVLSTNPMTRIKLETNDFCLNRSFLFYIGIKHIGISN